MAPHDDAGDEPRAPIVSGAHFAALDGLRGLAILMVLFVHFIGDETPVVAVERAMVKLANYGIWGVDLFFVLSGFLITGILYDAKSAPNYLRNFYVRRTLRIFPLYYGVLALLFGLLPVLPTLYPAGLAEAAHHQSWLWTYGTNMYLARAEYWSLPYVSHFWSLAVEEHFYLLWPLVVLACSRRRLLAICAVTSLCVLVLRVGLSFAGAGDVALVVLTPCRLDALCIGAYLALAVRTVGIERLAVMAKPWLSAFGGFILLTSVWTAATGGMFRDVVLPLRGSLVALFFGALLVVSLRTAPAGLLGRVLHSSSMRFIGKYSYGLYVFHGIIAYGLQQYKTLDSLAARLGSHLAAMTVQAILGAGLSLAVAVASYELFERHFLKLKDRFAPSAGPLAAPTAIQPSPIG